MSRLVVIAFALSLAQTGCVMVGGYSSEGGWFVWPWGFLISAVVIVLCLLWRRRR